MPDRQPPGPIDVQFQHAEELPPPPPEGTPICGACKTPILGQYYQAQGQVICPTCADRIQSGQQKPPALSLVPAALYGAGAALAGCILYATIAIVFDLEIGIIAIVVGWMVGKAVRHGSKGLGGRHQQILALLLTYFAITTSYIPVFIAHSMKERAAAQDQSGKPGPSGSAQPTTQTKAAMSLSTAVVMLLLLAAAAPFLSLGGNFVGGLITLFIIFIGLQRAWRMTGRTELLVVGPFERATAE